MMHHDAITGTHKWAVGEDYQDLMFKARKRAKDGPLGDAIHKMALGHGVSLDDLQLCELEGTVVHCEHFWLEAKLLGQRASGVVTIYNPNLESLHGFFLRVPRTLLKAHV